MQLKFDLAEATAKALGMTVQAVAEEIWNLATWIEEQGNHGQSLRTIRAQGFKALYLESDNGPAEYKDVWQGLVFYTEENGWQVRKNPHWSTVWATRYGHLAEKRAAEVREWQCRAEKKKAEDAARPRRTEERGPEGAWSALTTHQVGARWALCTTITNQLRNEYHGSRLHNLDNLLKYVAAIWIEQEAAAWQELQFRAAIKDRDALKIVRGREQHELIRSYFTQAQFEAIKTSALALAQIEPADPMPFVPRVVHVHSHAWANTPERERVYIGRNRKPFKDQGWGNPYTVERNGRLEAIAMYEADLLSDADKLRRLYDLRGKRVLGCWCKARRPGDSDEPCHGDILVNYAALADEGLDALIERAGRG